MALNAHELLIWGEHVVSEALVSRTTRVHEVFFESSERNRVKVFELAKKSKVITRELSKEKFRQLCNTPTHQGIGARVSLDTWDTLSSWMKDFVHVGEKKLLALIVDSVQDPQNLGTLIRCAHFFGVDVIVLSKDRVSPLSGFVAKASSGALFSVPIVRCVNLVRELQACEEHGFWRIALDPESEISLDKMTPMNQHVAIVVGNENKGIRTLVRQHCDIRVNLYSKANRDSLNAAIAGAIALYELTKQGK